MMLPMMPPMTNSGKKDAIVVNVDATTGATIARAPATAAVRGGRPFSNSCMAFSPTTMASSTIMPVAIISANMLIMLMLPPSICMTNNVPINTAGIPAPTQNATRPFKNKNNTNNTNTSPCQPFFNKRFKRDCTNFQRSSCAIISTPGGNSARFSSSHL